MNIYLARLYGAPQTQWDAAIFMKRELIGRDINHDIYANVTEEDLTKFKINESAKFNFKVLPQIPMDVVLIDEEEYMPNTFLVIEWKSKLEDIFGFMNMYGYQQIRPERGLIIPERGKRVILKNH